MAARGKVICSNGLFDRSFKDTDVMTLLGGNTTRCNNTIYQVNSIDLDREHCLYILVKSEEIKLTSDPLTGLLSRECFDPIASKALQDSKSTNSIMSVLFIDLDGFKTSNSRWPGLVGKEHDRGIGNWCFCYPRGMAREKVDRHP